MSRDRKIRTISQPTFRARESRALTIAEMSRKLECSDCRVKVPILRTSIRGTNRTLVCHCPQCQKEIRETFVDRGLLTFERVLNTVYNYRNSAEAVFTNIMNIRKEILKFLKSCDLIPSPEPVSFYLPPLVPIFLQLLGPSYSSVSTCSDYVQNAAQGQQHIKLVFRKLKDMPLMVTVIRDFVAEHCPKTGIAKTLELKLKKVLKIQIDEVEKARNTILQTVEHVENFKEDYEQCIAQKYTKA